MIKSNSIFKPFKATFLRIIISTKYGIATSLAILLLVACGTQSSSLSQSEYGFNHKVAPSNTHTAQTNSASNSTITEEQYIRPQDFKNWAESGIPNGQGTYRLAPGDYRSWGKLIIRPNKHRTAPLRIMGSSATKHPVLLDEDQRVIIEGFELRGRYSHPANHPQRKMVELENVHLEGLYISGQSQTVSMPKHRISPDFGKRGGPFNAIEMARNISVRRCLIENVCLKNAIRLQARNATIEECVIRYCRRIPNADNIAIGVKCIKDYPQTGIVIRNNEIYNCTDGIQFVARDIKSAGVAPGALVEGNDIYLTADYHLTQNGSRYAAAENGIDLKTGGTADDPMIIRANFIRGMRPTWTKAGGSGSNGVAMGMLLAANHIVFTDNIITDCPMAFKYGSLIPKIMESRQADITIENNLVYDLFQDAVSEGTVIRSDVGLNIRNNTFAQTGSILRAGYEVPHQLSRNLVVSPSQGHIWSEHHRWQMDDNIWLNPPAQLAHQQATIGTVLAESPKKRFSTFPVVIQPHTAPKTIKIPYANFRAN